MTTLAPTLKAYFTDRLLCQQRVSPNTVASYRDAFRLLFAFVAKERPAPRHRGLQLTQLDAPTIGAFLDHLEHERHNSSRTRNIRLAAIHSFFQYCALRHPEHAALIQRVLAIPPKRGEKRTVTFLTPEEVQALLDAPDRTTWAGRRDHALLLTAVQTGLRVSEVLGLTRADTQLGTGAHVRTIGKGRKERVAPLTTQTVAVLKVWMRACDGEPAEPVVPLPRRRIADPRRDRTPPRQTRPRPPSAGARRCRSKRITMHVLRHTAAMTLLERRDRHLNDRAVAGPRTGTDHARLPARRPRAQAAHPRPDHTPKGPSRSLPSTRFDHRVPRRPLRSFLEATDTGRPCSWRIPWQEPLGRSVALRRLCGPRAGQAFGTSWRGQT